MAFFFLLQSLFIFLKKRGARVVSTVPFGGILGRDEGGEREREREQVFFSRNFFLKLVTICK